MASRKRKTTAFRTVEVLADAVNKIVNYSDSDTEGCCTISHTETFLKACSKFQIFISYSFSCNYFFTEIMKEGAVDPLNGWHFYAGGYLNSW